MMKKKQMFSQMELNLYRMTNWQNNQWLRDGANKDKDGRFVDRSEHFLNLRRPS